MTERVMIFIDGSNFYFSLKRFARKTSPFNFSRLAELCCGSRKLVRIYYHSAPVHQEHDLEAYEGQRRFFAHLEEEPNIELVLGRLEDRWLKLTYRDYTGLFGEELAKIIYEQKQELSIRYHVQKAVDTIIAVNMLDFAVNDSYDIAILITGDGDFDKPIEVVKKRNKRVEVGFFKQYFSDALRVACNECIYLDQFISSCFYS